MTEFKKFLSQKEVEDLRVKKQQEWERIRKPTDPLGGADDIGFQMILFIEMNVLLA